MGAKRAHSAPAPLPVGETGGSKCQGDPSGGGSPARKGRSKSGSAQAHEWPRRFRMRESAEDRGDRSGRRRHQQALHPGAREGQRSLASCEKRDLPCKQCPEEKGSRRSVSIAPTREPRRDTEPTAVARPVTKAPERGTVMATPICNDGGARERVPPASDTSSCATDRSRMAETPRGSVHDCPLRPLPCCRCDRVIQLVFKAICLP